MTIAKTTPSIDKPLFATDYHVYINHTDAGGIVYHANHLVFFENARRDWFTQIGINGYFLPTDDGEIQHFVVSQAELKYRKAIFLDEIVSARIDKVELKPASIIFYQSLHRQGLNSAETKASDTLLSSGKIVIACVQNQINPEANNSAAPSIRPIRVPKNLQVLMQTAMNKHADESSK